MRVLVGCEYSGTVRDAFRALGHDAWSCDILPCDADPKYHFQCDIFEVIDQGWDLAIFHPPCTYLSASGAKWYYHPDDKTFPVASRRPHPKYPHRKQDQKDAIGFFLKLYECNIPKIAIENPVGIMSTVFRKPDQAIQPWQFGEEASKLTHLWLKNLPLLKPTNIVSEGPKAYFPSGKSAPLWYSNAPMKERSKIRSKTFQGIANAMAEQWGGKINSFDF